MDRRERRGGAVLDVMERTIMFQPVAIRGNVIVSSFILSPNDTLIHFLFFWDGRCMSLKDRRGRTIIFKIELLFWRDPKTSVLCVRLGFLLP